MGSRGAWGRGLLGPKTQSCFLRSQAAGLSFQLPSAPSAPGKREQRTGSALLRYCVVKNPQLQSGTLVVSS